MDLDENMIMNLVTCIWSPCDTKLVISTDALNSDLEQRKPNSKILPRDTVCGRSSEISGM